MRPKTLLRLSLRRLILFYVIFCLVFCLIVFNCNSLCCIFVFVVVIMNDVMYIARRVRIYHKKIAFYCGCVLQEALQYPLNRWASACYLYVYIFIYIYDMTFLYQANRNLKRCFIICALTNLFFFLFATNVSVVKRLMHRHPFWK